MPNPFDEIDEQGEGVAVAEPNRVQQSNPFDDFDKFNEFPDITPESTLGSFVRGAKSKLASGAGAAAAEFGAGLAVGPETGFVASIPAAIAASEIGSAGGELAYKKLLGDKEYAKEQAQIEANRMAGHETASNVGAFLPQALSISAWRKGLTKAGQGIVEKGGEAAEKFVAKQLAQQAEKEALKEAPLLERAGAFIKESIPETLQAGAILGGGGEAARQVQEGKFDPAALITHPVEEAIKFGPVGLIPGGKIGAKIIGDTAAQALGGLVKSVPDAAVMTLTSKLYDHYVHGQPLDLEGIKDETGRSIPEFMILNALSAVMHGGGALAKDALGRRPGAFGEAASGMTPEQLAVRQASQFDAAIKAAQTATNSRAPETAQAILDKAAQEANAQQAAVQPKVSQPVSTPEVQGAGVTEAQGAPPSEGAGKEAGNVAQPTVKSHPFDFGKSPWAEYLEAQMSEAAAQEELNAANRTRDTDPERKQSAWEKVIDASAKSKQAAERVREHYGEDHKTATKDLEDIVDSVVGKQQVIHKDAGANKRFNKSFQSAAVELGGIKDDPFIKPKTESSKPQTSPVEPIAPEASWSSPKLPQDLSKAKPRYSYGQKQFNLTFESDLDKAAYIAAQKNPSKRDADFVSWAAKESGLSEDAIRQHGQKVREAIKGMAKDSTEKSLTVPSQEPAEFKAKKQPTPKPNAIPEQRPAEIFPREQSQAGETGSERGGVGQGEQGQVPAGTRPAEEAPVPGGEGLPQAGAEVQVGPTEGQKISVNRTGYTFKDGQWVHTRSGKPAEGTRLKEIQSKWNAENPPPQAAPETPPTLGKRSYMAEPEAPKERRYRLFKEAHPESDAKMESSGRIYSPTVRKMVTDNRIAREAGRAAPHSAKDIDDAVNKNLPWEKGIESPTEQSIPSEETIKGAVNEAQKKSVGKAKKVLSDGDKVTLRQDIPSQTRHGVGVVVVSGNSKLEGSSYERMARVKNAKFAVNEDVSEKIAQGESKEPKVVLKGDWSGDQSIPSDIDSWTRVGFNPDRHSFFYDKESGNPVEGGDEAIQIGNTVYVKNPRYASRGRFRYMADVGEQRVESPFPKEGQKARKEDLGEIGERIGVEYPETPYERPEDLLASVRQEKKETVRKRILEDIYENHDNFSARDQARAVHLIDQLLLDLGDLHDRLGRTKGFLNRRAVAKDIARVEQDLEKAFAVQSRMGSIWSTMGNLRQTELSTQFRRQNVLNRLRRARGNEKLTPEDQSRINERATQIENAWNDYVKKYSGKLSRARKIRADNAANLAVVARNIVKRAAKGQLVKDPDYRGHGGSSINETNNMLDSLGYPKGTYKVVYDTAEHPVAQDPKTGKPVMRKVKAWVEEDGTIVLNARAINGADDLINELIGHEKGHLAARSPIVVRDAERLIKSLTKAEREKLKKHLSAYSDSGEIDLKSEEVTAEAVKTLFESAKKRSAFEKFVKKLASMFGVESDRDLAERIASDAMRVVNDQIGKKKPSVKGKQFMADMREEPEKGPVMDPQSTDKDFDNNLEASLNKERIRDDALEIAIVRAAKEGKKGEEFMKDVYELLKGKPGFEGMDEANIQDAVVDFLSDRFMTKDKIKGNIKKLNKEIDKSSEDDKKVASLKRRIKQYQERLIKGEFVDDTHEFEELAKDERELKKQLANVKRMLNNATLEQRMAARPFSQKIWDGTADVFNFARALMTSGDVSAVLRQGIFPALSRPIMTAKAVPAMFKAMFSPKFQAEEMDRIMSRPNADKMKEAEVFLKDPDEADLSAMEESFMSSIINKWPGGLKGLGIGSFVRGSERAYVTFLNRMRADLFDTLYNATKPMNKEMSHEELKALGNAVNVFTGRGKIFGRKGGSAGLNAIFFAPNYVASVFNIMFGQPLYQGSATTRKAVANEYARFIGAAAVLYGLASLTLEEGDSIETDPRSSDFGRIRYGNTRVNPLGGILQNTTLLSRVATGETKTLAGEVKPLRGPAVGYGGQTVPDVLGRYMRQKLSPIVGATVSGLAEKNVVGEPTDIPTEYGKMFIPISMRDIMEAMEDQGIPRGTALSILSLFGMGVNTFSPQTRN